MRTTHRLIEGGFMDEYKKASKDVWAFFQKHFKNADWDAAVKEVSDIGRKYENTEVEEYTRAYLVVVMNELGRRMA